MVHLEGGRHPRLDQPVAVSRAAARTSRGNPLSARPSGHRFVVIVYRRVTEGLVRQGAPPELAVAGTGSSPPSPAAARRSEPIPPIDVKTPMTSGRSQVVVQRELVGMGTQPDRVDLLLALDLDPAFDQIRGEHAALQQIIVVGLQPIDHRRQ